MKQKIDELKKAFCKAKTDKERDLIDLKMQQLLNESPDEFAQAMADSAKDSAEKATDLAMRQKLESVIPAISMVYIAKHYFNKTDAWLYQRINGNIVNGKPAHFTSDEKNTLAHALRDISMKLHETSVKLI
ncbi:MAG: DUF5053 domain-containing protein [Paludibacter sp.]|nr:DUF5053 domain-containing protein [Paludibacter sp.]